MGRPPGDVPVDLVRAEDALGDVESAVADLHPDEFAAIAALTPAPDEPDEIEVTPEELADDVAARLYQVNADLAVAFDAWDELPPEGRRAILAQARWIAELLPLLERAGEGEDG